MSAHLAHRPLKLMSNGTVGTAEVVGRVTALAEGFGWAAAVPSSPRTTT
jgi:hypothetical protein